jgi:hypothetical protein
MTECRKFSASPAVFLEQRISGQILAGGEDACDVGDIGDVGDVRDVLAKNPRAGKDVGRDGLGE